MNMTEFADLDGDAQKKYLDDAIAAGKSFDDVYADLGTNKAELGKLGIIPVKDKFMIKPMRGYQTTKKSGNEASEVYGNDGMKGTGL
jgi:hypothetical protein